TRFSRDGVQTCALPIYPMPLERVGDRPRPVAREPLERAARNRLALDERIEERAVVVAPLRVDDGAARVAREIRRDRLAPLRAERSEERRVGTRGRTRRT